MAVKKSAPPRRTFLPIRSHLEEARVADRARQLALVERRTRAATDVTRVRRRGGTAAARTVATRPTTGFDPRDGGVRLTGAIQLQPPNDRRCTAYATVTAVEAYVCRRAQSLTARPALSVSHLFSLSGNQETLGATADAVKDGVLEAACFPPTPSCDDPAAHTWRAAMSRLIALDDRVAEMCAALRAGQLLVVSVPVFRNFAAFTGTEVYRARGARVGAHALCIIGYEADATGGRWIVQNSFGPDWGDGGYARIAWNDGDVEPERVVYRVEEVAHP
ncbi:MAG: C1 family peptidase [Gemmatimonadaceae bacterium]|nr:C1 family peptidase [Gemmatimonadaceae bacterium]